MGRYLKRAVYGLLMGACVAANAAEQAKSLDAQVQDMKKEVLDISTSLIQLEEKLIYPANTQLSVFLSIAQGNKFRLDAVDLKIDGKKAARQIYTTRELDALQHGGVQRIYTGNIRTGKHVLEVEFIGKSTKNNEYRQRADLNFTKDIGTKLIEINLAEPGSDQLSISFKD
ncbi:MAG: hypothetical protein OEV15_05120 [Gallionella sp.]|nr:hypothetical protein [Gallionella sp.]